MRKCVILLVVLWTFTGIVIAHGNHSATRALSSFSFNKPFFPDAGSAAVSGWEIKGHTAVATDYIRLTTEDPNIAGLMTNRRPFFLKSLEISLTFQIHGKAANPGNGFAIWMTEQPVMAEGPIFGGPETWKGVLVIFESFLKDGKSKFSLHLNNGDKKFGDGTEVNSRYVNSWVNAPQGSFMHLFLEDDFINVFVDVLKDGDWMYLDPPSKVEMPSRYFFSLTASTGNQNTAIHDMLGFSVSTMDPRLALDLRDISKPKEEYEKEVAREEEEKQKDLPANEPEYEEQNKEIQTLKVELRELEEENAHLIETIRITQQTFETEKAKTFELHGKDQAAADCTELQTECSNFGFLKERLISSIATLQESMGHELSELQYLFSDETKRVETHLGPLTKNLQDLSSELSAANAKISQYSEAISQVGQLYKSKTSGENFATQVKDLTVRLSILQSTLDEIKVAQENAKSRVEAIRVELFEGPEGGPLAFMVALIVFIQLCVMVVQKFFFTKPSNRGSVLG